MLKKLIKHEWKDTWAVGTICCAVVVVMTLIGMVLLSSDIWGQSASRSDEAEAFTGMMYVMYFMMLFWGVVGCVLVIKYFYFYRYYKNLFTDQGYLMNTLPVKSTDLINSKWIVAVIWQFIAKLLVVFAVVGLIIAAMGNLDYSLTEFVQDFNTFMQEMDWTEFGQVIPVEICAILCTLMSPFTGTLVMYAAVGIGQMSKKYKFLVAVLVLLGINMGIQFGVRIMALPLTLGMDTNNWPEMLTINLIAIVVTLIMAGITVGLYFANKYFLEKKLNLE